MISPTNKIVKTITSFPKGAEPYGVNYGDGKIYVFDRENPMVYIINSTFKVKDIGGFNGSTIEGAYDPANGYEYVVVFPSPYVQIIIGTKISSHEIYEPLGPFAIITT